MATEQDARAQQMATEVATVKEKLEAQDEELKELRKALGGLNEVVASLRSELRRIEKPRGFRARFRR